MPTKVVYITGQSYSGSTVVCALLGVHPDMVPVSELANWPTKGLYPHRLCSCGRLSKDCEFWAGVRGRWLVESNPVTLQDYIRLQNRIERISYTWPQMVGVRQPPSAEFRSYTQGTVALYRSIAQVSGRPIIVDSSKKPGRAIAISSMEDLDVTVIHLVRSGLSYLNSCMKRGKLSVDMPDYVYQVFRRGLKWSVANYAAERAMRLAGPRGMRLRFEDLTAHPADTLAAMEPTLGLDLGCIRDHLASGRPISYAHMESGSHHRRSGPAGMRPEIGASLTLDRRATMAFHLGAGLLSRRYGYS